jgi:hypothetical protein
MKNLIAKLLLAAVFISISFLNSGCKSEEDKMIDEGIRKFENADFEGAAKIYSEVIKKNPKNLSAKFKLVSANSCINPDHQLFWKNLWAIFETKLNRPKPALFYQNPFIVRDIQEQAGGEYTSFMEQEINATTDAIGNNPENTKYYFTRGLWNYFLSNQQEAFDDFSTAVTLNKNLTNAYIMRAITRISYLNLRYYRNITTHNEYESYFDFKRALAIEPHNSEILEELGDKLERFQNNNSAAKYYIKAYNTDTSKTSALSSLIYLETRLGNYKEAAVYQKVLADKYPERVSYLIELASKKFLAGNKAGGLADLENAKARTKDKTQIAAIDRMIERNQLRKK